MKLPHFHWARASEHVGVNLVQECRCGMKRWLRWGSGYSANPYRCEPGVWMHNPPPNRPRPRTDLPRPPKRAW